MNFFRKEVNETLFPIPKRINRIDHATLQYMSESQRKIYLKRRMDGNPPDSSHPDNIRERFLLCGEGAPPIHEYHEKEAVQHLIDGAKYFRKVCNLIKKTKEGDTIYIAARFLDEKTNLMGDDDPEHQIGNLLVKKAAEGVNVRIIVAGAGPLLSSFSKGFLGRFQFRENYLAANTLRRQLHMTAGGNVAESVPPLRGRVLLSPLGSWTSSFHEKCAIVHYSDSNELIATVGGIDPMPSRHSESPHPPKEQHTNEDPAWHDAAVLVKGGAAKDVLDDFEKFWQELTIRKDHGRAFKRFTKWGLPKFGRLNPTPESLQNTLKQSDTTNSPPSNAPETGSSGDTSSASDHKVLVQILHSKPRVKRPPFTTFSRFFGERWKKFPKEGVQEIYYGFTQAIENAKKYIYIEDQYLREQTGGEKEYEIYPSLVRATKRGVKVILVGSGARDALDMDLFPNGINRTVNPDLQKKVLDKLTPKERNNVVVYRVEHTKVHAKVWAIDDQFATIGSANMFSRSHTTDQERTAAIATNGPWVSNFRSQLWAEHLRLNTEDSQTLEKVGVDAALGLWRKEWATEETPNLQRGVIGEQDVLTFVGPFWANDEES